MHDPTRLLFLRDIVVDHGVAPNVRVLKLDLGNWDWAWSSVFVIENAKSFLQFRPQSIRLYHLQSAKTPELGR